MKFTDEMVLCERCGVTFLWTIEERRAAEEGQVPPSYCMGCSSILPDSGRQRGLVKWYSPRRRYGFISPAEGADLFAHRSRFREVGRLHQGDLVEFSVEETEKGAEAVEVRLLHRQPRQGSSEAG